MSGTNAEAIRRWADALSRGDIDAVVKDLGPDTEWVVAREHPAATTHRGPDAIRAYAEDWLRTMPGMQIEIESIEERADRVLAIQRVRGAGAASGATADIALATITTFRDGKPVRTEEFLDPDEARRVLQAG
jgi:ketosteroid isomerase-like protein